MIWKCIIVAWFALQVARRTKVADDIKEEETVTYDEVGATESEHVQQSDTQVSSKIDWNCNNDFV